MCGWLLIGLLCPPALPFILLFGLLGDVFGGARARRLVTPNLPTLPPPPKAARCEPFLFRPVTPETDDSFVPATFGSPGVEAPGAVCKLCGNLKTVGDHAHGRS